MNDRFADTFYFIALISPADAHHEKTVAISASSRGTIVTTAWVLTEVADAMQHPANRGAFLTLINQLRNSPSCSILPPTQETFDAGLRLYASRGDKYWSLTDCISFVVKEREGITDALTADHHFEQAGFTALLK